VLFGVLIAFGLSGWTAPAGSSIIATVPVSKWFLRLRGQATGVVQIGLGFGGMILLPLTQMFITNYGWRSALVTLSWISLGVLPLVCLLVRQPSDIGLVPDGESSSKLVGKFDSYKGRKLGGMSEKNWSLRAAVRTLKMWKLCAAWALLSFLGGAASVHRVAHWVEQGFSPTTVSLAFGLDAASATLMAFVAGFLVGRFPPQVIGAAACCLFSGSLVLMIVRHELVLLLFMSGLLFGAAVGLSMVVQGVIWADHYGSRYVGRIRGLVLPVTAFCGGLGAPLAGFLYDYTGNYRAAWSIVLAACCVSGLLMISIRQTKHMNQ
jgi:MFS family permease